MRSIDRFFASFSDEFSEGAIGRSADFDCAPGLEGDCNNPGQGDGPGNGNGGPPFDPFSKGKGKNKGKGKGTTTPSEPE